MATRIYLVGDCDSGGRAGCSITEELAVKILPRPPVRRRVLNCTTAATHWCVNG